LVLSRRAARLLRVLAMLFVAGFHFALIGGPGWARLLILLLPLASPAFLVSMVLLCVVLTYLMAFAGITWYEQAFSAGYLLASMAWAFRGRLIVDAETAPRTRALVERWAGMLRGVLAVAALALIGYVILFQTAPVVVSVLSAMLLAVFRRALPTSRNGARPPWTWKSALGTAALCVASLAVSLCVLEAGARLLFGPPVPEAYLVHPRRIFTHGANASSYYSVGMGKEEPLHAPFTISSQGLRGETTYGPKRPNEFRVLMLGDSQLFGAGVHDDETIPRLLEERFDARSCSERFVFMNAGVGGYGPWQELDLLKELAGTLRPDLVVLQLYLGNDIGDTLLRLGKHLRAHNVPVTRYFFFLKHAAAPAVRVHQLIFSSSSAYRQFWRVSGGPYAILDLLQRTRFFRLPPLPPMAPTENRHFFVEVNLKEWYPELEEGWALMREDIRGIARTCRDLGVDLVAFAVPVAQAISDLYWRDCVRENQEALYDRDKDVDVVEQFLHECGIPYVPLRERMRNSENPESLYYRHDGHLTAKGARLVAEILAEYLGRAYACEE